MGVICIKGRSPNFHSSPPMKIPYSGNLDRIQIVKGWVSKSGATGEKVLRRRFG
jgi:hypothetical protein